MHNKVIFMYWNDGFENSPDIVKACLKSWKNHNKDYNIIELNDNNLYEYIDIKSAIPEIDKKNITKTAMSDIIRIFLLKKFGGFWIDATVFCVKPLDTWISNYVKNGFFAFQQYLAHIKISSWFLYGEKESYIIEKWYENVINYINNTQKIGVISNPNKTLNDWKKGEYDNHYFWIHYLFTDTYDIDKKFQTIWNNVKKLSTIPPHYIQSNGLYKSISNNFISSYKSISPLFKLTYKYDKTKCKPDSIINYLISSTSSSTLSSTSSSTSKICKIYNKKIVLKRYISHLK